MTSIRAPNQGAAPSARSTGSQAAWLPVLRTLGASPWFGAKLMVTRAGDAFDAEGRLIDADARRRLTAFVAGFADHCRGLSA